MAAKHGGLGRGLNALISDKPLAAPSTTVMPAAKAGGDLRLPVDQIRDNPYQPRKQFPPEALEDLAQSIKVHGVIEPIIVRPIPDGYQLVSGERRLRATKLAGITTIPVVVREYSDLDAAQVSLIENIQREDLNPIEAAASVKHLIDQFGLTQEDVARQVGKARATVTNLLRLLDLPPEIRQLLIDGRLSAGHGKVLLGAATDIDKQTLARQAVEANWNVRELEKAISRLGRPTRRPRVAHADVPPDHLQDLTDRMHRHFGTGVRIQPSSTLANGKKVKGTVEIDFYSNDDLTRILDVIGLKDE